MVGYGAEISISPSQQTLECGSDYNFDIILNTSGDNVVSSDIKFFLNGFELLSIQGLGGFDQFNNVGTGIATKGINAGNMYYYLNFYQNSFSNFISGSNILLARLNVEPISGFNNGFIEIYNLSGNDEDSNIAVGVDYALHDMPTQYSDNLIGIVNGEYVFTGCNTDSCNLSGINILNGDTIVAYNDDLVQCGSSCVSEIRSCNNGILSGTYTNLSCGVESCSPPPSGGGGGGGTLTKDDCPDGDMSISYYDGSCGGGIHGGPSLCDVDNSNYSSEIKSAYIYSYMYGITTMCPVQEANLDGYLQRNHFAKMISEFAVNVLGKEPDVGKVGCDKFDDVDRDTDELKGFMKIACELNLMGLNADGVTPAISFNGSDNVTRAQFGTVFSRLLFGNKYNVVDMSNIYQEKGYRYKDHLAALRDNGIMTKIYGDWPNKLELRGYVMLMMHRSDNYGLFVGEISAINGIKALFD